MTALRTQLEDGVIGLLAPLKMPGKGGASTGYLLAVKPYNGEIHRQFETADELRAAIGGELPCIMVGSADMRTLARDLAKKRQEERYNVDIFACSGSLRSPLSRTRGNPTGGDPGVYQAMEDVFTALQGQTVAVQGFGLFRRELEERLFDFPACTIWRATYSVTADRKAPAPAAEDLLSIAGKYQLEDPRWNLAAGQGDSFAKAGNTITLTDAGAAFIGGYVGALIKITGATTSGNNGTFLITAVLGPTQLQYTNANGAAEAYVGSYVVKPQPAVQTLATL